MSSAPALSTTSYAILGLLAAKSWTTHELVQQVDRSLRRFWPRAQSKLYEEPKKLVAHGLAQAADDPVGRRRRTRYTITDEGRSALAAWLGQPGDGPALEFEQLLKISFTDSGTKADLLANLAATRAWVIDENEENLAVARAYLEGRGTFPRRAALNQVVGRFLTDFYLTVARWTEWASRVVEDWPEDVKDAPFDVALQQEGVDLAESIAGVVGPTPDQPTSREHPAGQGSALSRPVLPGGPLPAELTGAAPPGQTNDMPDGGVEWGDLQVEFETFPAGLDTGPLLEGLPGDACPCPHWGYVFEGSFTVRYADHEETVSAGDAFYMAPGHVPVFLEDTEMLDVSPARQRRAVLEVVNANASRLGERLWEQR